MLRKTLLIALATSAATAASPPPPVDQPDLRRETAKTLRDAANAMFDFPFSLDIAVYSFGGCRFNWQLKCGGEVYEYLQSQQIEPLGFRVAQFRNWAVDVNRQCLDLMHSMLVEGGLDPDFNRETDYELEVKGEVLPAAELSQLAPKSYGFRYPAHVSASFRGSQLTYVYANGKGQLYPAGDPEILNGIEVTASITLDQDQFEFRTPITGSVRLTNTGTLRVPIGHYFVRHSLDVFDGDGNEPERIFGQLPIGQQSPPEWRERFLRPGETYEEQFTIYTNAGEVPDRASGYKLDLGEWTLSFTDLIADRNIPTVSTPVRFEVTGDPESYRGPRTRTIIARGDNLILFREGGWIEAVDAVTGRRRGLIHPDNSYLGSIWPYSSIAFSSDGRLAAFGSSREKPVSWLALYGPQPQATSVPMTGELRPDHRNGGTYAIGFGPGDQTAVFESNHGILLFDIDTGEEIRRLPFEGPNAMDVGFGLSPDGRYIVSIFDVQGRFANGAEMVIGGEDGFGTIGGGNTAVLTIVPIDDPDAAVTRTIVGRGEIPFVTPGRRGAYLVHGMHKGVTYQPYDQEGFVILGSEYMAVESESADGSLVALRTPGGPATESCFVSHHQPTTIEVWHVAEQKRLYSVGGDGRHLRAFFIGTPARLAVLERATETKPNWYLEEIRIYDGRTGEFLDQVDLTPREPFLALED